MQNPITRAVAKLAGKSGAIETRLRGLKGVFTTLAEQHHATTALLSSLEHTADLTRRRTLWTEAKRELVSHEHAELLQVYPSLGLHDRTAEITIEHTASATDIEGAVREVDTTGFQADDWLPAMKRLVALVKAHTELEERDLFPRIQAAIGEEGARRLDEPFRRAKEAAMKRVT